MSTLNGAHAARIDVCGKSWRVRRELELALRLEERFGALGPLLARLRAGDVPIAGLADLLEEILAGQDGAPVAAELRAWVFEQGSLTAIDACLAVVASLFVGAETAAAAEVDAEEGAGEPIVDPPRASSAGAG